MFYKSKEWKRTRELILQRDNYECQICKANGKYSKGNTVHHIIHYRDNKALGLEPTNLITLCKSCHNLVHPEKVNSNQPERFE